MRRATALAVQEALEAEQRDFVGREWYERGERRGYRSGYTPGHLDTGEGRVITHVRSVANGAKRRGASWSAARPVC
ncbi:MAG: hypothetical protein ACRDIZ_12050 [Actinomycetota bacterium]